MPPIRVSFVLQRARIVPIYLVITGAAVASFLSIRAQGDRLQVAPSGGTGVAPAFHRVTPDTLSHVLLALAAVIVVARIIGVVLRRLAQPPVISEILAGIMPGPSLQGRLAPGGSQLLFPPDIMPLLGVVSQIDVVLY